MITLGTSPDPLLWEEQRGLSGCGLYFTLCKQTKDWTDEVRIFWYRHDQRVARWFRTPPYGAIWDGDAEMNRIKREIYNCGNANGFIERASVRRRDRIQRLYDDRCDRREKILAESRLLRHPNYGRF